MKVDAFTYALMNNIDPVTGQPLPGSFGPKQFANELYSPNPQRGMPGSGGASSNMVGYHPGMDYQTVRSANQPVIESFLNGLGSNIVVGTIGKIGEGIGMITNIPSAIAAGDINKLYDNSITNAFERLQENTKENLPIYQGRKYEGNILSKMMTDDFWFNDGFDAVSFLLSAYAPGALAGKAAKLSRLGKLAAPLNELGTKASSVKVANLLKGVTAEGLESGFTQGISTAYNTITEAGFEAKDTFDHTFEEYKKTLPEEEARKKASEAAARVFSANMVGLLVPNAIQSSFMHGTNSFNMKRIKDLVHSNKPLDDILKNRASYLANISKGIASEGLWEENFQNAVQRYEDQMAQGWVGNRAGEYAYGLMLGLKGTAKAFVPFLPAPIAGTDEDEAATAVALGGLIGGGMAAFSTQKERENLKRVTEGVQGNWNRVRLSNALGKKFLVDNYTVGLKDYGTVDELDADGNPTGNRVLNYKDPVTGQVTVDPAKMTNLIMRRMRDMDISAAQVDATLSNDKTLQDLNREMALMSYAWHLKSIPNLSKEDLDDLIKYDIQLPVSKDLDGVVTEDLLSKNISKLHKYIQLYDKTESAVGGMYDFSSQASDRDFGATMRRSYFYDASKKLAFEHMKENASDTQKAQIDTIIQEIDTHLNSFSRLIPQFKDAYDKEIATNITNGKRLDEIDTLLKDKNTKDEDKVNLEVEKRRINYVLEEAVNVDNYYAEEFGGERATEYASASLSRNEPAVHARKRGQQHAPLSMSEKYYYNKALTELFNIEIAKDLSSATPVENIIEKVRHRPELALTADNEVRLRESLAARVAEVEDASSAESLEAIQQEMNSAIELDYRGGRNSLIETEEENEEYQSFLANNYVAIESAAKLVHGDSNPYTLDALSENPNMFLDLYRDIDRTAKAQRTQEAKVKAYQDILDKVHTESENLKADNAVLDKQSNEQRAESFKEVHFNDKTNDIRLTIDKYQKDKDNFAERVDGKIAALKVYKEIFSSRTDISEALRDRIIAKIDKWIELLTEAMEVASKNLAKRYEIQKLSEVSYTEGLKTLIKDPVFEEVLRSILGNELDTMLKEISSYSEKKDSMEGYEALLETVRRKATPEQLKSIETTIVEISNREGAAVKQVLKDGVQKLSGKNLVIPFGALENIRGNRGVFLTNPLAAISRFLFDSRLFGERVEAPYNASGELTPFQRYKLDLDFPKLMYELSDKNFEGLNQTEKELLQALYEIYYKARAYHAVLNITQSGVDSLELYKYEAAEFGSTDKKTPTAQQAISVREAARQINNSSLTNNQSAVFGIFGSGKTVMVAKKIMNFLVPKKDRKNKILAFAQSEATSEKIANSVEGTQTSYKEFIAMPAEKVTQFEYLVIDEAFTLHSNQIDVIDSYARTVGIKVLYLGDPSQNKSEDTAMLQNNITQAQPLTVVLRTNNPAITKFATSFQHNPLAVNEVIAESTSTLTNKTEKDSGVFVTAKDKVAEEQIVELAKRNNGKTKLIISNHNLAYYKEKLQGTNVKVLSPYDSQGQEADEVYLDLSKQGEAVNGGPLRGDLPFNTMMATAASRAVNTLVVANRPGLNIIPVILHNLEESILNLENEFAQYEEDYKTSLNAYKHFYSKFTGISLQGPKESTIINTKDAPSPGKVVDDKEEPTPVMPEPTPIDGDMVLRYSSNDNTKDIFTGEGLVVRAVVGNEGVEKEKWVVMAPSAEGFRIAGVLSADEIKTGSFTLDQLKRAESRKEVFKLATNKTIAYSREQLQPFVIAPIQIKYVRPLSFSFGDRNPITTASINWLMRNFFNKERIPLEGTIDSKLRIYTNPSSQQPDTKFQPKAGVPYVILRGYNVPEKNKGNFPNLLHIPVQAPKLNTSHKTVKSLTKLKTSFDTLSNLLGKDPRTFFNSEEFETMLDKFVNLHTVDPIGDTNRIVRVADFDQKIDAFQEQFKVKQEALVPLFDVMTSLYGVGKNDTRFTLEEYEQWKKDNPDLANNSHWKEITFKKRKEGDPVYGRVTYAEMRRNGKMRTRNVEHYIISQNAGDAALAWDDIASSNKNLGGYFPRILVNRPSALSQTKTKFVAKALLGHKDSHRRAFQIIKDTFFRRYQQIVNNILAEIDPNDPNKPYLESLEDDLDMYARTTYGTEEYEKVIERLNFLTGSETYADKGPVLSDFELFSEELDETGNPKKITPREFLEGKSSYAVPYEAIEAITEPSNYLPSGFYKDENALYANLDLHRDGSITFDMGEVIVDTSSPETFDSYGFSSDVKEILPTRIIVNFSSESKPKETPAPPTPRNPEVIRDNTSLIEKVASIEGIDVETVADLLRAKFGFVNTEEAKKYLERIIKMHEEMARLKDKPDEDDFNRAVTVFADTTPGSLQTIEWAKTVLQKILPGIDIDKQVEFLDNLQMSVFENPEDNILGRVGNAILKLKIDENKLVYDEVVYHEAFHMAYRYLFSESTRTRLKATFRELYGQEFTDRQVTEGLAELYQRYEERASIKKGWLRKLLEDLRAFFDTVFKNRLYLERTFFNLDEGKYSAIITSKTKEGAPDNMQFVKTNFGTRSNYIHAVRTIKERIVQYLQHGTLASEDLDISLMNLPMNRKEIFDAIYDEFVQKHVFFEEQKEDKHAQILKHYNVKSLEHLSRKIRENQSVLDKGTLDIDEKEFLMEQTLDMHKALKEFEALSNLVTLYNTITNVNKKTGKYIFFEIIENLYPSYKSEENYKFELDTLTEEEVQGFTDADREALNVSEDADANSILEAFEGLRAETIDHAKVNWASKQSLSLKDFFSFIPLLVENSIIPEQKDGVLVTINSKVAYVRALQLLLKLNLNTSNINEEIAYLEKHEDLNRWDRSILHKLQEIFGKISDIAETRPPYTIVAEAFPLKSDVNYYFFADLAGTTDANSLSFEAAKALHISDPNRYKLVTSSNNSLIELYHQAAEILPISQETFKNLYEQREALNTIANIQSFMGSLKDTEYKHSVKSVRGKSRFLSMVTNRGNDYQVNNKALIKEAFRKNLDSSKSLLKDEQAVTLLANKLKSENVKEQSSAIRSLLEKLELTKDFKVINQHKLRQNRIAISEFLTTLTSSSSFPTITVSTETAEGDLKYDVDSWLIQNNSALNALAKVVAKEEQQPKTTSIISVKKQKIYKHTLTNPIYKFGNKVINYQERIIRGVKEDSGLAVLPKALELVKELNPFLIQTKNNRFLMRMHSLFELDGHKDRYGITEYANDVLSFDKKRLHTTLFSSGFLNNLISGTYEQLFYQQADKPRPIGAVVDLLSENQLDDILPYLEKNAKYFLDKDRAAFFKMHNKKYNSTNVVNGKLIGKALESTEGFSEAFKKLVAKEAIKLAKDLVAAKTDTVGSPAQVKALENKFNAQELLSLLNEALSEANMSPISGIQQLAVKSSDKGNYQNTVEMFVPYAYAYLMNHYVNSYFMNQLVAGSSQFYGDAKTVLKRMTGAAGPGHGMWINERFGTKSKFKAIVIGDPTTSKEEIFNQVLSALNKEHSEEELTALKNFFGLADLERTDGQVFLTPTRLQNLQKGLGREFRLSNIIKPKFFGPRIEKNNVTGEEFAIPTYIKPSGVVLSDELLYEPGTKTPRKGMSGLAAIREKMDKHGIDELVFASAVKAGLPAERHTLEEFMKSDQPIKGILELENEHYQIQLNPRAKVDSSAALFTQLSYFLNIYSSSKDKNNVAKAETVYSAIAFLFEKGGKLFGRDVATPEKFKNLLMRAFSENGDELIFADLIESGIAPNSPIFEKKAMIKLASMMEKLATKIRLPGGKLVLQSDVTVLNPHTGKPLKFLNDNGKLVAEVIVPRGLFSEEVARQIEAGINTFENPMLLGFRIPSTELHSAVAMKVVGFYDGDLNTNMVIAPELLVALHGSDFDVDSLFFAKRPSAKKEIRISTKQDIADIITLAQELEEALLDEAFTNHSAHGRVFDALQKIRKGIVSEGPDLTPEEYEKLATPRVLLSIEQDFQQFVKDYNISVKTESNDLAARKKYAELAGLAWLEKKKVDHAVTRHERGLSKDENLIKTSRKWTIRSADSYALFDIRREMFNLAKDENLAEVFPQIKQTLDKILQGIQRERIIPQEIFLKEGDFIGFEKGDDGVYRFNPDYDDYLSTRLRDLRKLEEEAKLSGFKKLEKIIAKQYKDLLGVKEDYYKGSIVDVFLETISDPANEMRMMRPISKSYLVGRDDNGEYAESSAIHTVAKHGLVEKAELDLSNYNDVYPAFKSVADMQRLTGIFASAIKVLAYIGRSGVNESTRKKILDLDEAIRGMASNVKKLSQAVKDEDKIKFNDLIIEQRKEIISLKDQVKADLKAERKEMHKANNSLPSLAKNLIFDYKVGDKIYKINSMNEFILGTNETVSIYDVLDALVNIAIDNVKDQELFALQATVETGTMYAALISLGLPASDIITMMYNPVMQDMLTLVRNDSSVKINEFIKAYKKIVTARLVNVAGVPIEEIDFSKAPIGIQDLEYMLTADPFKALKITLTSGKKRKIDTVANLDSLTKKQLGELYQFLHIMDTATHLGDNIKNISSFLSILRGMPITFEGIQEVEKAIEKLGRVIENENDSKLLDSVDTMSRDEILDILNTLGASFYTKEKDAGYKIEGFFSRNPHILSAYRRLLQLKKAIQDNFPLHSQPVVDFMRELFGGQTKISDNQEQAQLRSELRKYLLTQIINRDFYNKKYTRTYNSRRTGKTGTAKIYGVDAWAAQFVETVRKVQVLDKENAERDNRAPNAFLEALYIDNGKLKFNFDIELDRAMIEELRLGFNQLKVFTFEDGYLNYTPKSTKEIRQEFGKPKSLLEDYDIAYDATEFQKDILYYLALVDGLRFSNSNYSVAIPPRLTKILMKDLEKLETSFRDDETLRKKLAYHIKVELLRENASMISSYIDPEDRDAHSITNEESKNETAKDDQGKEISQPKNGIFIDSNKKRIFYDQAYRNPYTSVVERQANLEDINNRFPAFITSGYDDNVEVYMRVTNPLEDEIAYISLGRSSGTYTRIPDMDKIGDIEANFKPNMVTQYLPDKEVNSFHTRKDYSYVKPGEPIRIVEYSDKSRLAPRLVVIKSQTPRTKSIGLDGAKQVPDGFDYIIEDYIPEGLVLNSPGLDELFQKNSSYPIRATDLDLLLYPEQLHRDTAFMGAQEFLESAIKALRNESLNTDNLQLIGLAVNQLRILKAQKSNPLIFRGEKRIQSSTAYASYYAASDTIVIRPGLSYSFKDAVEAIIHEVVHANTASLVLANFYAEGMHGEIGISDVAKEFASKYGSKLKDFNNELFLLTTQANREFLRMLASKDTFDGRTLTSQELEILTKQPITIKQNGIDIPYGFKDQFELLAEFFSNPKFRELTKLIQLPFEKQTFKEANSKPQVISLFGRIISTITKFFQSITKKVKYYDHTIVTSSTTLYDVLETLLERGAFDNLGIDLSKRTVSVEEGVKWFKGASEGGVPLTPQQMFAIAVEHYGLKPSDTSSGINFNVEELIKNVVNFDHTIHNTDAKIKALKERAENYEVDPTDASKYQEKKVPSNKFMRVSDDEKGWIAQFKRRPKQVQTIEERAANMWGSDAPTTTKFTRHGWIAQDAWIEKEKEIEARGKNRGRLIHGLIELYANGDSTGTIRTRIDELMNLTGYEEKDFAWVKDKLKYIFSRAGINSLDNVKDEHKDRVVGEVTVANEILGLAGTIDMLIFHSDGTVSIKDIKAGYNFLNSSEIETMLFGEQPVANDLIWDTWKNHAQLQVMTYALLYKLQNPEAKFNSLDILWMPDADAIFDDTFRNKINPEVFLNMIKSLLERKMPDKLKALKESMSEEAFNKLWDPTEYKAGYQKSIRDEHTRMEIQPVDQQIKAKIQKVRTIILEDLNPHNYRKATIDSKKKTELVSKLMREILELQKTATDLDISTVTEDIGKFQNWLFTSSTVSNPYIQTWDQLFMAKRDNFNKEVEHSRNKFLSLLEPIKKEYLKRNPGKGTLDAITRGGLNFIDSRKLFEFAYVPVKDEGGVIIDYRLRFSDKDFQELVDDNINFGYINASNVHIYKNFLDFVNDTYEGFFVNKDGKTALANRVATYVNFKGFDKPITNLELYNGKRVKLDKKNSDRDKELFEYKRGFMPKVPPLLSEFGLLSKDERLPGTPEKSDSRKNWRRIWFQRNLTFAEEHIFEGFDKKAMAEGLPMKYLNNRKDFASNPDFFTLNLEHQFDRFTRAYMWKEQMDDVFAYGQGLRIMFNAQEDAPERLIAFMQRELDLKLRGRPSDHGANEKFLSKNKYNVSVVKVLSKIKFAFNYPLLALNYLGGSANAIFTTLLTLKHGIQNTTFRNKSMSGLNGDEWDFGVKHLAQAYPEVMKIMKAGMVDGNIRNSKVYQLAKKFGYLPSSFDWSTAPHNLTTSGNRVFNTNLLFMFYSMPEEFIAMLVMTAQLMSMKVTHGNLTGTSLYDMYELVDVKDANGNTYKDIKWKDDATTNKPYVRAYKNVSADPNNPELAELTELDELEVRRLYSAYDKMHGGYRSTDKIYLDYNIFGQLALQFKRYLPHILRQGMTSAAERSNLGFYEVKTLEDGKPTVEWVSKVMEGRWPIVGKVLARGLVNLMDIDNVPVDAEGFRGWVKRNLGDLEGYDLSKLDRGQREAFRDAWVTMLIMFMGLGASFMAGGDGDDDDPVNRYVSRIFNDLTQMYNISELGKNLVNWNPISLKKLHDFQRDSLQVMFSIMFWGIGNEERAFTPDGRLEGMNALMKDLPVTSIIRKTEDLGTSDIFDD